MTTPKKIRATVLIEWSHAGSAGVLVHADSHTNTWILPGGGLEEYRNGRTELPLAAAARELYEETGLTAESVTALFQHTGGFRAHHVFQIQARGKVQIVDSHEAPAFGLCGPDMTVTTIACDPGYATNNLALSTSTQAIIEHYRQVPSNAPVPTPVTAPAAPVAKARRGELARVPIGESTLKLIIGGITSQDVDAVVNAANTNLTNGSGVSGALHKDAGAHDLETACRAIGRCPTGEARITPGFKLKARHIIHAVGPIYHDYPPKEAAKLLASAYRSSLELARSKGLHSIAFPSLSTGVFGFPIDQAAKIAVRTIAEYLAAHAERMQVRLIILDSDRTRTAFETEFHALVRR